MTAGNRLLFGPGNSASALLVDPATGRGSDKLGEEKLDLAGNELANEIPKGGIAVGLLASKLEEVGIPITPLVLMSQVRLRRALS